MVADDKPVIGKTAGKVSDITFRDIYVIAEEGVFKPEVRFASYNGGVRDIFLERVYYNGELQTDLSRFHTENCNVDPILL
jgi:hypothetical protein